MPLEFGDIDLSRFATAAELFDELRRCRAESVVVHDGSITIDDRGRALLADALREPMAATASPVPLPGAGRTVVVETSLAPELPPAPPPPAPTPLPLQPVVPADPPPPPPPA